MADIGTNGVQLAVRLKNADEFLPVTLEDANGTTVKYYGGDQSWFSTRVGRYSGCGAVAAADIFAYLALQNPALSALYDSDSPGMTKERFLTYMEVVLKYVAPLKIPFTDIPYGGLTSLERFTRYCDRFIKSRGVKLKGRYIDGKTLKLEQAVDEIAAQLEKDNPVALLVMQNSKLKCVSYTDAHGEPVTADVRFHWMVITALEKTGDKIEITVSSEGGKLKLDFTDVWTCDCDSKVGWRGLVYFSKA